MEKDTDLNLWALH